MSFLLWFALFVDSTFGTAVGRGEINSPVKTTCLQHAFLAAFRQKSDSFSYCDGEIMR